jgi:transcriptional regulator with XRE-family HTH domain
MDFQLLQGRLTAHLRTRVRNGEITERSLARLTGISQPHIHNVLKGTRFLSTESADRILRRLRIDLVDLLGDRERLEPRVDAPSAPAQWRTVALLDGCIGPGCPYPAKASPSAEYPFLAADLEGLGSPVAARVAPDPYVTGVFSEGDVLLLDCSEASRRDPDEESYYALDLDGDSAIRLVRRDAHRLYLLGSDFLQSPPQRLPVPLSDANLLQLIRGRVSMVVARL